jgi:hypothetical protein
MPSTTSGTTDFSLDVDELIEDALESVGGEHTSGNEARKIRRKLNLILIELQNKGVPINKVDNESVTIIDGQADYELDPSISSVLQLNYKQNDVEVPLTRYGEKDFHQIPVKSNESGRASVWSTRRGTANVTLRLWPVPNADTDTVELLVARRIEDVNAAYQRIDLPYRFLPLLSRWLSYEVSLMRDGTDPQKRQELKMNYMESMNDTFEEDRERVDMVIRPTIPSGR